MESDLQRCIQALSLQCLPEEPVQALLSLHLRMKHKDALLTKPPRMQSNC